METKRIENIQKAEQVFNEINRSIMVLNDACKVWKKFFSTVCPYAVINVLQTSPTA